MDRGFPACGYLLQRYLQRFYEGFYKFTHTRERAARTHTRENQKTNWFTVLVNVSTASGLPAPVSLICPPTGGNMPRFARPPGAASAPRNRARARFLNPGGGCYAPPLKNALRVVFARLTPQGAAAPPAKPVPPAGLFIKERRFQSIRRHGPWRRPER